MPALHDDDDLLGALRTALDAHDPVPADAVDTAVAAFDLGHAEAHLADLLFDSLLDEPAVPLRGPGDRAVTYEVGGHRLRVELSAADRAAVGHLDPPTPAEVTVTTAAGASSTRADEQGRFRLPLAPGSLRFGIVLVDAEYVTPWLTR